MENNSSGGGGYLAIVCGTVFCVIMPIISLVYSFWGTPTFIKVFYVIWIVGSLAATSLLKDFAAKFGVAGIATLIYAMEFCAWYSENALSGRHNDGELGELIFVFLCVAFTLVPIGVVGIAIDGKINDRKREAKQEQIKGLEKKIEQCNNEIEAMEASIHDRRKALKVVRIISLCGGDTSAIEANPAFAEIRTLSDTIEKKRMDVERFTLELDVKRQVK